MQPAQQRYRGAVRARIDRIQLTSPDRAAAAAAWVRMLDAEPARADRVAALGARRSVRSLGRSELEILQPDGAGPAADHLAAGGGVFAAGISVEDLDAMRARLEERDVRFAAESGQLFVDADALGIPGLRVVLSSHVERAPVGLITRLYEVTHLVDAADTRADAVAQRFGLARDAFVPIRSEAFGYTGWLTLFDPDHLDRIETITPGDSKKTMGRYFAKRGAGLYMCYGECNDTARVRERALEHAPGDWTGPQDGAMPDNLFLHPRALGGAMLGVSRATHAWTWSGHPERVTAPASPGA